MAFRNLVIQRWPGRRIEGYGQYAVLADKSVYLFPTLEAVEKSQIFYKPNVIDLLAKAQPRLYRNPADQERD
jgi:hypothetical protein